MGRGKQLVKNTGIIAIGKISTRFISFFLLPLYTAVLSKAEYGVVDVFNTCVRLLLPIVTLMVGQGAFRYLIASKEDDEKKKIITVSTFTVLFLFALSTAIFVIIFLIWDNEYDIYLWLVLLSAVLSDYVLQLARGFKQLKLYAIGGVISSSVQIVLNVVFLTIFKMGPIGMFWATIVGNSISFIVLFLKLKVYTYIQLSMYDKESLKRVLQYSAPLVSNQLSFWLLNSSDRFIVNLFMDVAANGILGVSHKFPEMLTSVFNIFQISWHEMGTVHYEDSDKDVYYTETFHQVFQLFGTMAILLTAILPIGFEWLVDAKYMEAYYTIPIYIMATVFNMVIGFLGAIYMATNNTREISKTTIIAGVINVIVHVALIRYIGLYAAAASTWISYFIVMIYRVIDTRKYVEIKYDKAIIGGIFFVQLLVTILYYSRNMFVHVLGVGCALIFAFWVNRKLIGQLVEMLQKRIKK